MASAQRFAAWLTQAMRAAGLDIDRQRGGGRAALADACGVSRSTVGRWLEGQSMPGPEHFRLIAERLRVPVADVLIQAGVITAEDLAEPPLHPAGESLGEVARRLGIPDGKRLIFEAMVEAVGARLSEALTDPAEE